MGALENGSIKSNNKVRSLSKICFILFCTEELAALNICSKKLGHVSFHFHPYFRKQECFFLVKPSQKNGWGGGGELGQTGLHWARNYVFYHFLKFGSLVFL